MIVCSQGSLLEVIDGVIHVMIHCIKPTSNTMKYILITEIQQHNIYRKNLGRLWLAYTELQGGFYMLQLISIDSRHFTQPELSLGGPICTK